MSKLQQALENLSKEASVVSAAEQVRLNDANAKMKLREQAAAEHYANVKRFEPVTQTAFEKLCETLRSQKYYPDLLARIVPNMIEAGKDTEAVKVLGSVRFVLPGQVHEASAIAVAVTDAAAFGRDNAKTITGYGYVYYGVVKNDARGGPDEGLRRTAPFDLANATVETVEDAFGDAITALRAMVYPKKR